MPLFFLYLFNDAVFVPWYSKFLKANLMFLSIKSHYAFMLLAKGCAIVME